MAEFLQAIFHKEFREDVANWIKQDRKTALKIIKLVEAIMRDPYSGIGKHERLKYIDGNTWSRRISQEHRIDYYVTKENIQFIQARLHY